MLTFLLQGQSVHLGARDANERLPEVPRQREALRRLKTRDVAAKLLILAEMFCRNALLGFSIILLGTDLINSGVS